jgi:acetate kinase
VAKGLLVLNAGSSSVKFALFERENGERLEVRVRGEIESIDDAPHSWPWHRIVRCLRNDAGVTLGTPDTTTSYVI